MGERDKFVELPVVSSEEAVAKAVDRLSTDDKITLMGMVFNRSDVLRLNLAYSVGDKEGGLDYKWLIDFANRMLCLNSAVKGARAKAVENVAKAHLERQGGGGILEGIKSFVHRG